MATAPVRIPTRKISETILDFGEPLLGQSQGAIPLDEARPALEIVIMIWNAHVMAMPVWGSDRRPLSALADLVYRAGTPAEVMRGFEVLSARRIDHFDDDPRAVGQWELAPDGKGGFVLRCDARVPPALAGARGAGARRPRRKA